MKYFFSVLLLFGFSLLFSQSKKEIIGSVYIDKIGSVCEETSNSKSCGGYEIFVELIFKKENVLIKEKGVDSCNKLRYQTNYLTSWTFRKPDKIIIKDFTVNSEETINNYVLLLEQNSLIGKPINDFSQELIFEIKQ
ncbi:hypothetical protein HXZ94_05825 [Empedobacter falsenii]|uniref:hypothetical protein n=1 Tax=Empedobacter falsenii TaxID=343874 RepID=UPI002577AF5C|nr:hypothetical protein [Empedobacter falsenii]MDM1298015.1 hypothetical protein [Empedobacter falsenii]MDM1317910.1 hypothetical protein [Empedobacter falsenii]